MQIPTITLHTNRREALQNSDFVQTTIQVGGYKPSTVIDFEIPKKFGLNQTIGDTLGIGGIMRGLRTIPVLLRYCKRYNGDLSRSYLAAICKSHVF